jgi:hypothetical protein
MIQKYRGCMYNNEVSLIKPLTLPLISTDFIKISFILLLCQQPPYFQFITQKDAKNKHDDDSLLSQHFFS